MLLIAVLIIAVLSLVIGVMCLASLGNLHLFVRTSDSVLQDELGLIRDQIETARAQNYTQHRHAASYLGGMLEEIFPALGLELVEPLTPQQLILRKQILSDPELAARWGVKDDNVRKKLYAEMVEKGEGIAPWERPERPSLGETWVTAITGEHDATTK